MFSILQKSLHSSPFFPNPLCLSAFREVKSHQQLFTHSSPPSTSLFIGIPEGLVKSEEYFSVLSHFLSDFLASSNLSSYLCRASYSFKQGAI
jgi:hypothetical protein